MRSTFGLEQGEEQTFTCSTHGEYRGKPYRMRGLSDPAWRTPECPQCRAEEDLRQQAADREEQAMREKDRRVRKFALAGIPPRFRSATFDGYRVENMLQRQALVSVKSYADRFARARELGTSMMLMGSPGTGKTHLMCALASALMDDWQVLYTDCYSVLSAVKSTFRRGSEETEDQVVSRYTAPALLLIDEIGVQYGTDAERAIIHRVLDLRYQHVKPTVVAGNVDEKGMASYLGERAVSRLHEANGIKLKFEWPDYRKRVAA